ncbi:uncharacterized protein [Lolium perenne]|uniref:uncharacterized protein n=1 Tax=Lolium perenne TaxID=4522 RepID=UPI003A9A3DF7
MGGIKNTDGGGAAAGFSSGSGSSNPFAGPSVAVIRDIPIAERVPVKLSTTAGNFFPWKTYFGLLFREYDLLDHVDGTIDLLAMPHDAEWLAIDATIIRWFYQTVSNDIFRTVVCDGDSAHTVWAKITGLFTDNKIQRVTFLQQEFFGTHQNDLSDDYALKLKSLSDELRDLEFPIDDKIMLSTLSVGLGKDLSNAASNLTLLTTPTFEQAVAYLRLEERRLKHLRARAAHTAFVAGFSRGASTPAPRPTGPPPGFPAAGHQAGQTGPWTGSSGQQAPSGGGRPCRRRRGGGSNGGGNAGANAPAPRPPQHTAPPPWTAGHNPWTGVVHAYSMPVPRAPYPGIMGPRPATHQAFYVAPQPAPAYAAPPGCDPVGSRAPDRPPERPLRRGSFCRDNPVTVEFDAFGFSVKDGRTRMLLHRCDSPGDLYPIGAASTTTSRPLALSAGVDLWHARLGHPSSAALRQIMQGFSFTYVAATLTAFFAFVSTQFGRPIHALQTDNGKEFDNITIRSLLATHGIVFRLTCPYTSSQNGRAERMLRTLNDCVRTLLFHASMPPRFWPDALATATLLVNIRPCRVRTLGDTSDDAPGARWPSCGRGPMTDRGGPLCAGPAWSLGVSVARGAPSLATSPSAASSSAASSPASPPVAAAPEPMLTRARAGVRRPSTRYPADKGLCPLARSAAGSNPPASRTVRSACRSNRSPGQPVRSTGRFNRPCDRPGDRCCILLRSFAGAHLGSRRLA